MCNMNLFVEPLRAWRTASPVVSIKTPSISLSLIVLSGVSACRLLTILDTTPGGAYTSGHAERGVIMPTAKKQACELMKKLPEQATWDDIMYEIYVCKKIEAGIHAAEGGRVVPHESVKKRFLKQ